MEANNPKERPEDEQGPPLWLLPCIVLVVVILWCTFGWFANAQQDPGKFGDMFGAVNALFSGLAFGLLIYTMLQQRAELRMQRLELKQTRDELAGQREQMQAQSDQMRLDSFENTFFKVLTVFSDIADGLESRNAQWGPAKGRDTFRVYYDHYSHIYRCGWWEA